jgi:transcription elongation factor Elf1
MALELVKCRHCGCKFRIDVEAVSEDGETVAVRGFLDRWKTKPNSPKTIDLKCQNCEKWFEWKLRS